MTNGENEEILGMFPGFTMEKGKVTYQSYRLVFTNSRLIIAREKRLLPGALIKPYYIYSQVGARDRLKMQQVSPVDILKENSDNFEISYADIAALECKSFMLGRTQALQIFTKDNLDVPTHKISIAIGPKYMDDFISFLQNILPDKI